jgi:hypothetical protein
VLLEGSSFFHLAVMNSTYIYLRARDSYIYVQEGENIQKKTLEKYNNRNTNIYLTPPQTYGRSTTLSLER